VHEYERQGVTATLEMQRAARKVAQDNCRLRRLLALHGVSQEEVDAYLRREEEVGSSQEAHPASLAAHDRGWTETESSSEAPGMAKSRNNTHPSQHACTSRHWEINDVDSDNLATTTTPPPPPPPPPPLPLPLPLPTSIPGVAGATLDLQRPKGADDIIYTCSDMTPSTSQDPSSVPRSDADAMGAGLEISCQAAAAMIAEMRGDGDEDLVRDSLGCNGRQRCTIKNTTVLQVMDQSWE